MKKLSILFIPFLYTFASILQLFYVSAIAVSPNQILRPLIVLWAVIFLVLWPIDLFVRDRNWTTIIITALVLCFYFSPDFFSTILMIILIAWCVWFVFGRVRRLKVGIDHFLKLLAGVGVFFVCYSLFLINAMLVSIPASYKDKIKDVRTYSLAISPGSEVRRDIYYIVLDGYTRSDVLQELFDFDNLELVTYLQDLGFIVVEDSHSNYPATHLSVSSTLNMDYVQEFSPGLEKSYNRWLMKPFIDHSRVRTVLEEIGYRTISISSNWTITENTTAEIYYHPYIIMLSDFEGFFIGSTPLRLAQPFLQTFASVRSIESQRKTVLFNFETLASIPEIPGPKFVVAHIISPHPPFIFEEDGATVELDYVFNYKDGNEYPGTEDEYKERYLQQLKFVNLNLQKTISSILEKSEIPPIIIIQADHGSGMLTDFSSSENTCIKERFSPFAAYYYPELSDKRSFTDLSAVNTFRIMFNEYLGAELPLLEGRQYYYQNEVSYYEFEDVTSRISDKCK